MNKSFKCCLYCNRYFDSVNYVPKILPCSHLMCKSCLDLQFKELSKFRIDCNVCYESNVMDSKDGLPTSDLILAILSDNEHENVDHDFNQNQISKIFSNLKQSDAFLRIHNYDIYNHYFSVQCDIDCRAERLILAINLNERQSLINKLNDERDKFLKDHRPDNSNVTKFSDLIKRLNEIKQIVTNSKSSIDNELFNEIVQVFNQLQSYYYNLKKSSWYFAESTQIQSKPFFGHLLNSQLDNIYTKIRNLELLLNDESQQRKIVIGSKLNFQSSRDKIIPLGKDRIIIISFQYIDNSLCLQQFNSSGEKRNQIYCKNLKYYPVCYGHGNYFCISYPKNDISLIELYDSNLNLVASTKSHASIETVFMNENYIAVMYYHRRNACCSIFDYNLHCLQNLGQQIESDQNFYMPNLELSYYERVQLRYKFNPKIFGLTEKFIYLFNHQEMFVMNRQNGIIDYKKKVNCGKPYFLLDEHFNIIQICKLGRKIVFFNIDTNLTIENTYKDCFDTVFLTQDQTLAFIDKQKNYLVMV
jgi:hypothetical protein